MAITNAQAVDFVNNFVRPLANQYAKLYYDVKAAGQFYTANNLAAVITNTADVVADGAAADGRPILTGAQVRTIVTRCNELITDMEATTNAKLNSLLIGANRPRG